MFDVDLWWCVCGRFAREVDWMSIVAAALSAYIFQTVSQLCRSLSALGTDLSVSRGNLWCRLLSSVLIMRWWWWWWWWWNSVAVTSSQHLDRSCYSISQLLAMRTRLNIHWWWATLVCFSWYSWLVLTKTSRPVVKSVPLYPGWWRKSRLSVPHSKVIQRAA